MSEPDDQLRDEIDELHRRAGDDLQSSLTALGVHPRSFRVLVAGEPPQAILTCTAAISLRGMTELERPDDDDEFEDRFRDLIDTQVDQDYEARRRQLLGETDD